MVEAYLHDPDVIEAMANADTPSRKSPPSLFGWTSNLAALRDIQDQMIAQRGGTKFVPRPVIPGFVEKTKIKDSKLRDTISRITGSD